VRQGLSTSQGQAGPISLATACAVLNTGRDEASHQSLVLLPLHRVMGHRLQCMSAAIGLAVPHIEMDTVGSIRASGCVSKRPKS
jgi:hypothetical protein